MTLSDDALHEMNAGEWIDWPAGKESMEEARQFITETARESLFTVIVPDKDADGLSAALIVYRTLQLLGLSADLMHLHFLNKGRSIHHDDERNRLEQVIRDRVPAGRARIIIVDQGSRPARPIVRSKCDPGVGSETEVDVLIIDHHQSLEWPDNCQFVTACRSSPICTSSLLTYLIVVPLHGDALEVCAWPALIGICGDLGGSEISKFGKIGGAWPITKEILHLVDAAKRNGKKEIGQAVGMLNAPRRTAEFNGNLSLGPHKSRLKRTVCDAWDAILKAKQPSDILYNHELNDCRQRVNLEVERCTHAAPKFSKDSRVALLRINSKCQIHPVIATRWSGTLKSKKLQCIMVVNPGHHPDPDMVSFSCRIASSLRKLPDDERPNLRELLKEYAAKTAPDFLARVGQDFASGHNEATGGIIRADYFEEFAAAGMEIGVPDPDSPAEIKKRKLAEKERGQTKLASFFSPSPSPSKKQKV